MDIQLKIETETPVAPIEPEEVEETAWVLKKCPHISDCLKMKTCLGGC